VATGDDFSLMLRDYRMTLAEILYHLPDHPKLLQTYIWQELDIAPRYPQLHKFLGFWESSLDGKLHSVRVDSMTLITPQSCQFQRGDWRIH
tara:strand:+ start:258 stop:530 length:273 start_codon:yes stop_codon:yes gene_type:complete